MTNPYSVPIEELDAVHVAEELQVLENPLRYAAGALVPGVLDGGGGGTDGDGD